MSQLHEAITSSLSAAGLLPGPAQDLIPRDFDPKTKLGVAFDDKEVELGTFLRASDCKNSPAIRFEAEPGAPVDASYLLLLIDPDAPTPDDPKFAFWRHWVLPGLQPVNTGDATVAQTKPALTEYLGPGPKDEEPEALYLAKEDVGGEEFVDRRSFKAQAFTEKYSLRLAALNWMTVAGDGWKAL